MTSTDRRMYLVALLVGLSAGALFVLFIVVSV
jgi:hypothetical protein